MPPKRCDDRPWTKNERELWKNPVAALAAAVVQQWKLDGCPSNSKEAIDIWKGICNEAVRLKRNKP